MHNYYKSDAQYADGKYTTSTFHYVWRKFKIGKYKGQDVKRICYINPNYIDWCKKNWDGFKLTKMEHWDYIEGLKNKLTKDPENEDLQTKIYYQEKLYELRTGYKPQ